MEPNPIGPAPPTPLVIRRRPLNTIEAVRRQAANLFWDARRGRLTAQEASRLANVLAIIFRMIEGGEMTQRIEALEATIEQAAQPTRPGIARGELDADENPDGNA